jgi:hypothetical protein
MGPSALNHRRHGAGRSFRASLSAREAKPRLLRFRRQIPDALSAAGCASRVISLRAGPVVMPSHTVGRHAHQAVATGYHSLGSAWPTVSHSGRRIASARQSHGSNRGILGGNGETPPGALGLRTLSGSPRTVVVSCRPLCPFRGHLDDWDGQCPNMSHLIQCTPKNSPCTKGEDEPLTENG